MIKSGFKSASELARRRKRIIIVDDIKYSLVSLKSRLCKYYDIYPAESAQAMYELLADFEPDLILLDVNMPHIDGYDTIKNLKSDERYAQIPVIFVTGNSDRESVVKGLSLGAADYVIKPYSAEKLIESIENHLNIHRRKEFFSNASDNKKTSVLVVDDISSMLRAIQYALHDRYKVFILSRPEDAVDFLRTNKPDLILLDYLMPVLSGFDLIPIIRHLPDHKNTPIIIITTEGTVDLVNEAMSIGAYDFIVKPFKPKELNDKVAKHIRIASELQKIREEYKSLSG